MFIARNVAFVVVCNAHNSTLTRLGVNECARFQCVIVVNFIKVYASAGALIITFFRIQSDLISWKKVSMSESLTVSSNQ